MSAGVESNALNLRWTFGFNSTIPNSVHSLVTPDRNAIFYVAAHTGIILDTTTEKQSLLQGHCHEITATCVSADKRFIVTADSGNDSMIVVWDSYTAAPLKTIIHPFPAGTCAIDISKDGRYIAALSHNHPAQELAIYEWQVSDIPAAHTVIDASAPGRHPHSVALTPLMAQTEYMHCIRFNPADPQDVVTNGASQVVFWLWGGSTLVPVVPAKGARGSLRRVGALTQTTFLPHTTKAATATSRGSVLVWDYPHKPTAGPEAAMISQLDRDLLSPSKYQLYQPQTQGSGTAQATGSMTAEAQAALEAAESGKAIPAVSGRDCVKSLSLCNSAINILQVVNGRYVVCACGDGAVRFFDLQFRVAAWYEHLRQGALTSASFAIEPEYGAFALNHAPEADFSVPELTVATAHGRVIRLSPRLLDTANNPDGGQGVVLARGFDGSVDALDTHPSLPVFAAGTSAGQLQLWDLEDRELLATRTFTTAARAEEAQGRERERGKSVEKDEEEADEHMSMRGKATVGQPCPITCVKFAPGGKFLCTGFADGRVELTTSLATALSLPAGAAGGDKDKDDKSWGNGVIDPLQGFQSFHVHRAAITHIAFAPNEQYIAVADAARHVSLFKYTHTGEQADKPLEWVYLASNAAHFDAIVSLHFEPGHVDLQRTPAKLRQQYQQDVARLQRFFAKCPPRHLKLFQDAQNAPTVTVTRNPLLSAFANSVNSASNWSLATKVALLAAAVAAPRLPFKPAPYRAAHPRLLSVGRDGRVVEYDVPRASIKHGLRVAHVTRAEVDTRPTASCVYSGAVAPAREFLAAYRAQRYQDLAVASVQEDSALVSGKAEGAVATLGTGGGAGLLSVGPNVGGTYPPLPLLMSSEPSSLQVQAETLVLATSAGKFTLWHSQPPLPLAARTAGEDTQRAGTQPTVEPAFWWRHVCSAEPSAHNREEHLSGINCGTQYQADGTQGQVEQTTNTPSSALSCLISAELVASSSAAQALVPIPPPPSLSQPLFPRKTVLAPTHDADITRMLPLPLRIDRAGVSEYLVYACDEQLVGLARLPLSGSPNDSIAVVAHPNRITQVACTADGRYILTAGGADRTVNVWAVNVAALDAMAGHLNSLSLDAAREYGYPVPLEAPLPRHLPGPATLGKNKGSLAATVAWNNVSPLREVPALTAVALNVLFADAPASLRKEVLDHFCHCQLRWQGLFTTKARTMSGRIAVSECITLLRSLGCFPSEAQVKRLHHQVLWDRFVSQGCLASPDALPATSTGVGDLTVPLPNAECITLAEAVQLLVNYRPVSAREHAELVEAMRTLACHAATASTAEGEEPRDTPTEGAIAGQLSRQELVTMLSSYGECLGQQELNVALRALLDHNKDPAVGQAAAGTKYEYMGHNLFGARARRKLYGEKKEVASPAVVDDYVSRLPEVLDASSLLGDILGMADDLADCELTRLEYTGEVE